jgi:hypothetical protein
MAEDGKANRDRLLDLSKLLLGSQHQAEIGAVIADAGEPVWGTALIDALELDESAKSMMSNELSRLRRAKLLVPAEDSKFDRRKLLNRADPDSPYWALCQLLRRESRQD